MRTKSQGVGYAQKSAALDALRKENQQLRSKVKRLEKAKTTLQEKLQQAKNTNIPSSDLSSKSLSSSAFIERHKYKELLVSLCVNMYVLGHGSLRGVLRQLDYLNTALNWGLKELPCKSSVENWIYKAGYRIYENESIQPYPDGYGLIIDECMVIGQERMLAALTIPATKQSNRPLQLQDATVTHLQVKPAWDGDAICESVVAITTKMGQPPAYIISDGCGNLRKGFEKAEVKRVADVSHQLALFLEQTYKKNAAFIAFNKDMAQCRLKEVMKPTAYLLPPKQRVVARFMNLSKLVQWAEKMLLLQPFLSEPEQQGYGFVKAHTSIIKELSSVFSMMTDISSLFKKMGLSYQTIESLLEKCNEYKQKAIGSMQGILDKIKGYLLTEKTKLPAEDSCWHNSSDIIESLFGFYKSRKATNPLHGVTPFVLLLPLFTKTSFKDNRIELNFKEALETVYLKNIKQWNTENLIQNQTVRRKNTFQQIT